MPAVWHPSGAGISSLSLRLTPRWRIGQSVSSIFCTHSILENSADLAPFCCGLSRQVFWDGGELCRGTYLLKVSDGVVSR